MVVMVRPGQWRWLVGCGWVDSVVGMENKNEEVVMAMEVGSVA